MYGALARSTVTGAPTAVAWGIPERNSTIHEALMLPSKHVPQFLKTWHFGDPDVMLLDTPALWAADLDDRELVLDRASPPRPCDPDDPE